MNEFDPDFEMPEPTTLCVSGDWHGDFGWADQVMRWAKKQGADAVLQVGDFGYYPAWDEFTRSRMGTCHFTQKLTSLAKEIQMPLYWLDGNHENHEALTPGQGHDGVIRHLPRGHRWQWWGKTWMAVGGAASVDREWRTPGLDWFPEETLTWQQLDYCTREGNVDIIVSHDAPKGAPVPGISYNPMGWPEQALRESDAHRAVLSRVVERTHAKLLIHGHYHTRYQGEVDGCRVIGLGKNRAAMADNCLMLTRADVE